MKEKAIGAVIVPLMNSRIVRPLEILAMNIPEENEIIFTTDNMNLLKENMNLLKDNMNLLQDNVNLLKDNMNRLKDNMNLIFGY